MPSWIARIAAFVIALTLLACSQDARPDGMVLNRGNGGEPKTLDPQQIDGTWESNIVGDMFIGLTTDDAAAKPIPGAALSWETSKDGLVWTFHLRPHLWGDGVPVTAQDFVFAWRRLLDPRTAAPYAYNLWIIRNGEQISAGRMNPNRLGVSATDDKTLVVTLSHPAPYLTQLLTHHTTYPVPRHLVEKFGDAWSRAGTIEGNGPYSLMEWIPHDHVKLVKNSRFYDAAHVRIDTVNFYPTEDSQAALKRMRAGELDVQNPLPATEIDWLRANMPRTLRISPYLGVWYIAFNEARAPFSDRRIREAVNLAVDREIITDRIYRLGEKPAYKIVPPGVANYPETAHLDFRNMGYSERIAKAQALMRAAGFNSNRVLHIRFSTTTDPDLKRTAVALQAMLQKAYIDLEIVPSELHVHFQKLQQGDFEMAAASWIADFNDASNFLDLLRSDAGNNYGHYRNPAYDSLLDAAQAEPDAGKRAALLEHAEQMALDDYAWGPVKFLVTKNLVQPYVKGWVANLTNFNRTRWLWVEKH